MRLVSGVSINFRLSVILFLLALSTEIGIVVGCCGGCGAGAGNARGLQRKRYLANQQDNVYLIPVPVAMAAAVARDSVGDYLDAPVDLVGLKDQLVQNRRLKAYISRLRAEQATKRSSRLNKPRADRNGGSPSSSTTNISIKLIDVFDIYSDAKEFQMQAKDFVDPRKPSPSDPEDAPRRRKPLPVSSKTLPLADQPSELRADSIDATADFNGEHENDDLIIDLG